MYTAEIGLSEWVGDFQWLLGKCRYLAQYKWISGSKIASVALCGTFNWASLVWGPYMACEEKSPLVEVVEVWAIEFWAHIPKDSENPLKEFLI